MKKLFKLESYPHLDIVFVVKQNHPLEADGRVFFFLEFKNRSK